jgi:hypothetical protein
MTWRRQPPTPLGAWLIQDEIAERQMVAYLSDQTTWQSTWSLIAGRARFASQESKVSYRELYLAAQELADECVNRDAEKLRRFGPSTTILPHLNETDPELFREIVDRVRRNRALAIYIDAALAGQLDMGTWTDTVFATDPELKSLILPFDLICVLGGLAETRSVS